MFAGPAKLFQRVTSPAPQTPQAQAGPIAAPPARPHPPELRATIAATKPPSTPQRDDVPDLSAMLEEAAKDMSPEEARIFREKMRQMNMVLADELAEIDEQNALLGRITESSDTGAHGDRPSLKNMKKKSAATRTESSNDDVHATVRQLREQLIDRQNEIAKLRHELDGSRMVREANRSRMQYYEEALQAEEKKLAEALATLQVMRSELSEKNARIIRLEAAGKKPVDEKGLQRLFDAKDRDIIELKTRVERLAKDNARLVQDQVRLEQLNAKQAMVIEQLEDQLASLKKIASTAAAPAAPAAAPATAKAAKTPDAPTSAAQQPAAQQQQQPDDVVEVVEKKPRKSRKSDESPAPAAEAGSVPTAEPASEKPRGKAATKAARPILKKSGSPRNTTRRLRFAREVLLLDGALDGDVDLVRQCVQDGADVNVPNEEGLTPLHSSSCNGHGKVVKFLLENGARVNVVDDDLWTPLHGAACFGEVGVVRDLVRAGANIVATNAENDIPLAIAMDDATRRYLTEMLASRRAAKTLYTLYAYTAAEPDELSFGAGEALEILTSPEERATEDWWLATNAKGEQGLVPHNYLAEFRPAVL